MIRRIAIAVMLLCGLALAQPQGGRPEQDGKGQGFGPGMGLMPHGRWWKNANVVQSVGLSDDQVQKIEQIFQESRLKLVDQHANLQKEEIKLEPLLEADNPDESAVDSAIDRITAAHAALEKANAQMAFAVRRVLTPDQWKKLRALRQQHRDFPAPMGGLHGGGRMGDQHGGGGMMHGGQQPPPPDGAGAPEGEPPAK